MLFMVLEHSGGNAEAVGARFRTKGRMLYENVTYQASWMEETGARCLAGRDHDRLDFATLPYN
jgi:hypothetical protein